MEPPWSMRDKLWEFQQSSKLCDLFLQTDDGQSIHVHKLIASASSPYFQAALLSEDEYIQTLTVPKVNFTQLQAVVEIIYRGTTKEEDPALMQICEDLQIPEGIRFCKKETESVPLLGGLDSAVNSAIISTDVTPQVLPGTEVPDQVKSEIHDDSDNDWSADHDSYDEPEPEPKKKTTRIKKKKSSISNKSIKIKSRGARKKLRGPKGSRRCTTCHLTFDSLAGYQEHREVMHAHRRHRCTECDEVFKRPKQLLAHRVLEHYREGMPEPEWYYCQIEGCDYKSIYNSSIESHFQRKHMDEGVVCEVCGKKYQSSFCVAEHKRFVHKSFTPARCSICLKDFKSTAQLKTHIRRVHELKKPYLCEKCPYRCFDSNALRRHVFKKHKEVPVEQESLEHRTSCPHCDYSDPSQAKLRDHIARHGPKKFQCTVCGRQSSTARDLRVHMQNVHATDNAWLNCPYDGCSYACKACYGQRAMQKHIDRMHEHRNYKPWACTACSYCTNVKGNLRLHMKKVHGLSLPSNQHLVHKLSNQGSDGAAAVITVSEAAPMAPPAATPTPSLPPPPPPQVQHAPQQPQQQPPQQPQPHHHHHHHHHHPHPPPPPQPPHPQMAAPTNMDCRLAPPQSMALSLLDSDFQHTVPVTHTDGHAILWNAMNPSQ